MKIHSKNLYDILRKLDPAISSQNTIIDLFQTVTFDPGNLFAYNDRFCIRYPLPDSNLSCTVKAQTLLDLVKNIDSDLTLSSEDSKLYITGPGLDAKLNLVEGSVKELASSILSLKKEYKTIPNNFIRGLMLCSFSTVKDVTRPYLEAVCVRDNFIFSSDNFRISMFVLDSEIDDMLLPASSIKELNLYNITHVANCGSWIVFKTSDGIEIYVKTLKTDFPELQQFFAFEGDYCRVPDSFKEIVETVSPFSEAEFSIDKTIEVIFQNGKIACRVLSSSAEIYRWVNINSNKDFIFKINPDFLKAILDKATVMKVGQDRIMFRSGSFRHLISLPL